MKLVMLLPIVLLVLSLGCIGTQEKEQMPTQQENITEDIGISEEDIGTFEDIGAGENLNDTIEFGSGIDEEEVF